MMRAGSSWVRTFRGLYRAAVRLAVAEKLDVSGWGPGEGLCGRL